MLRYEVREHGGDPLPALDLEGDVVIGSGPKSNVRLPHTEASEEHVKIAAGQWTAIADVTIGDAQHPAGSSGTVGDGIVIALGKYRVSVAPSPTGSEASTPQRTQSLARELVRAVLGGGEPPKLSIIEGPIDRGAERPLGPPECSLVVGRGDDADWVILDEDLSRVHVEIQRNWDGVWIRDLESKNGTKVDDVRLGKDRHELRDGATITIGNSKLAFKDPAERHLRAGVTRSRPRGSIPPPPAAPPDKGNPLVFWIAIVIAGAAIGGLVWLLVG
jgi:hypothetical protein